MIGQFTAQEQDIINANIFDSTQDIFAWKKFNFPNKFPNTYTIKCSNLPVGTYRVAHKHADFHFNTLYEIAYCGTNAVTPVYDTSNPDVFVFTIKGSAHNVTLKVSSCTNIEDIVKSLRKEAIANNSHNLQQDHSC